MSRHRSFDGPPLRQYREPPRTPTRSISRLTFQSQDRSLSQGFTSVHPPPSPSMDVDPKGTSNVRGEQYGFESLVGIDPGALFAAGEASGAAIESTPFKTRTTKNLPIGRTVAQEGKIIEEELGEYPISADDFAQYTYNDVVDEDHVNRFLRQHSELYLYREGREARWNLPRRPKKEKTLYPHFIKIINEIVDEFVTPSAGVGVAREAVDTHDKQFRHKERGHHSAPDLAIYARGPSFQVPSSGYVVGYSNVATVFDVKRSNAMKTDTHIQQLGVYSRQILAHQPNRRWVRCLLLSEENARMVHYDRAGVQVSPLIDIHKDAGLFVRLIVGLCNADEETIGLDTSVQWTIIKGRKTNGILTANGPDGPKGYRLLNQDPVAAHMIRGRGTTCWSALDPDTNEVLVIKDSWIADGHTPEHEFLEAARGLAGVCEFLFHEEGRGSTADYRCVSTLDSEHFNNRVAVRVVIKGYGTTLLKFKTVEDLLLALRDAIAGHARLYAHKILHRDISDSNVLLGVADAPKGSRGVLIDLSEAVNYKETKAEVNKEARSGSRFFQSCTILDHLTGLTHDVPPAHDYLDDLESFFYLLSYVLLLCYRDGSPRPLSSSGPKVVEGWDSEDPDEALRSKMLLFNPVRRQRYIASEAILDSWGEACTSLFEGYLDWVIDIQMGKATLVYENHKHQRKYGKSVTHETQKGLFAPLLRRAPHHYNAVLGLFDAALISMLGPLHDPEPLDAFGPDYDTLVNPGEARPIGEAPVDSKRPSSPALDLPGAKLSRVDEGNFGRQLRPLPGRKQKSSGKT